MVNEPESHNLDDILRALQHEQETVRERAIQRLKIYSLWAGKDPKHTPITEEESKEAWERRSQFLQRNAIVEVLLAAMEDSSSVVRTHTALMLGQATACAGAQDALLRHLRNDQVPRVRMMCAVSLSWTQQSLEKFDGFVAALQDSHYQVVSHASLGLGEMGDKRAIEPLKTVLSHSSWQVRFSACQALVHLEAVNHQVIEVLEEVNRQSEAQDHDRMLLDMEELYKAAGEAMPETTTAILARARALLS
jgi:HEAT repeat protein